MYYGFIKERHPFKIKNFSQFIIDIIYKEGIQVYWVSRKDLLKKHSVMWVIPGTKEIYIVKEDVMEIFEGDKDMIECIFCHELCHAITQTADEERCDRAAIHFKGMDTYLRTLRKTLILKNETRFSAPHAHRNKYLHLL